MNPDREILFPPFRLDLANERLWRGAREIPLRRKTFAFLRYLVESSGRLVTKEELLEAVWNGDRVSVDLPRGYVQELRDLLEDDADAPRLIETVRGRGYRFLAATTTNSFATSRGGVSPEGSDSDPCVTGHSSTFVGRAREMERLHAILARALAGDRQIVFVSGEAGIGKTMLVERFLRDVADNLRLWVAPGQCLDHHGSGEPYLPVLEALGRRCRDTGGRRFLAVLDRYAPTWLAQMPWFVHDDNRERLDRAVATATRERMLREIAEALEVATAEAPLILLLEDLHASDSATLDLIAFLAQRREPARLLVIGTYRSLGALGNPHPLRGIVGDLHIHGRCGELSLDLLTGSDVHSYLTTRFAGSVLPPTLASAIHRRTDGNPLFMTTVVDTLITNGSFVRVDDHWETRGDLAAAVSAVPEGLRRIVERQIESLTPSQLHLLEVASVAGVEFVASELALALGQEDETVEELCLGLADKGFVRAHGVEKWADGSEGTNYRFIHSIYQEVLYGRLPGPRRSRLHRQIGDRLEIGHRSNTAEVAAKLALHFERGRDAERALRYLRMAGEKAVRRHAPQEAIAYFQRALTLVEALPETAEPRRQELALRLTIGGQLIAITGYAAPEVEKMYGQARVLCHEMAQTRQLFPALHGLWLFYASRPDLRATRELASELVTLAEQSNDRELLLVAHWVRGSTRLFVGELLEACEDLEQATGFYDPSQHLSNALVYGQDPGPSCSAFAGIGAWLVGHPEQALIHCERALSLAMTLAHPVALASALSCTALVHHLRGESGPTRDKSLQLVRLAEEEGLVFFRAWGKILLGWATTEEGEVDEGIRQMRDGLQLLDNIGIGLSKPYFMGLVAEVCGRTGQPEAGMQLIVEALDAVDRTGEAFFESELVRLQGELALQVRENAARLAEQAFRRAVAIARRQGARSFELRAVSSLARLLRGKRKKSEADKLLRETYTSFSEGFETRDLIRARAVLQTLQHPVTEDRSS